MSHDHHLNLLGMAGHPSASFLAWLNQPHPFPGLTLPKDQKTLSQVLQKTLALPVSEAFAQTEDILIQAF